MSTLRLVVSDVDGTLVTSTKELSESTIGAVARLRDAGVALALTSGRPPRGLTSLVTPLALSMPLAGFNGGLVVSPELVTLLERALPPDTLAECRRVLEDAGLDVWVYRGRDWYVSNPDAAHVARESATVGFEPTVLEDLGQLTEGVVKFVGVSDDPDAVARGHEAMREHFADRLTVATSQPYYLDVTNRDANKGGVIDYLCATYGFASDEVAAIGDTETDVSMFERAGVSIAMGNATPSVQRSADFVTRSNDDEGFAHAVATFVLDA